VQHAHQKGLIHRDLKPSNILVAESDHGLPAPKIIDFGVAKAAGAQLTDATLQTRGIVSGHAARHEPGAGCERSKHRHADGHRFARGIALRVARGSHAH